MSISTALAPKVRPAPGGPGWEAFEIERVTARLSTELAGRVEPVRIRREVERAVGELRDATVRQYVPLLVERRARRSLRDAAPAPITSMVARSAEEPEKVPSVMKDLSGRRRAHALVLGVSPGP